jgi:transcriptional regulator with XRE-family HTH domain
MKELPDRWRELGEFIREQRAGSRLSLRRLSDLAGVSNPYLSQIERGLRRPSAEILQQIAKALRISAETLYERAGLLEAHEGHDDTLKAILRDPSLTEDAKQTLLKVYLSLRTPPPEGNEALEPLPAVAKDANDAKDAKDIEAVEDAPAAEEADPDSPARRRRRAHREESPAAG